MLGSPWLPSNSVYQNFTNLTNKCQIMACSLVVLSTAAAFASAKTDGH